jgi:hypothetical protein
MYKMQSIFDIAMVLLLIFFLLNLGGCATIGDYCEEKPEVCATAGAAAVFVGTVAIVHAAQPKGVVVKQNAPSAPITISPYCPTCTT